MKPKRSLSRFYLSNIIFYTSLLTLPLSAIEQINQSEDDQSSAMEQINQSEDPQSSVITEDEWANILKEESSDERSSPKLRDDKSIMSSSYGFDDVFYKDAQLEEQLKEQADQLKKQADELEQNKKIIKALQSILNKRKKQPLDNNKKKELFEATKKGMTTEVMDFYYTYENVVKAKNKNEENILHLACLYSGSVEMVDSLLDTENGCGMDIETKGYAGRTPFLCAAQKGQLEIAKRLKERGADINAQNKHKNNALHFACLFSCSEAMVTWLLDKCKIEIKSTGFAQRTAFLCAARNSQLKIAKLLKERGANINAKDRDARNALHLACLFSGSVEMVTWLLNICKIGIKTKEHKDKTPFLCAAQGGHLKIAKLLKERGANSNAQDKDGNNALHLACAFSGSVQMVTWLLDTCKIEIESKGQYEKTPLHCAAEKGQLAIIKLLEERGANMYARSKDYRNAYEFAKDYSKDEKTKEYLKKTV